MALGFGEGATFPDAATALVAVLDSRRQSRLSRRDVTHCPSRGSASADSALDRGLDGLSDLAAALSLRLAGQPWLCGLSGACLLFRNEPQDHPRYAEEWPRLPPRPAHTKPVGPGVRWCPDVAGARLT